ncbi:MAG TPA: tRNA pseudouridine(38-40) synthase TruA [Firmicutes bacterium]|nr:tRNA pseudouridine(38-40) synthase TruA [Candidatus Fermentithermobacillaceae bacterium]
MQRKPYRRIRARVQYDGTAYAGFQRQKNANTVQETLERCLEKLLGHPVRVKGAGRTDAGVHARGQIIAFNTENPIPADRIPKAVSGILPGDIVVDLAEEVPLDFDPVKDAVMKTYCYRLLRSERPSIFWQRYAWWYPDALDFDVMVKETEALIGKNDFMNFRALWSSARTTERQIFEARWVRKDVEGSKEALWEFWISADGFLYKMVRLIVGTLVDVGRGYLPEGIVREALLAGARGRSVKVGKCAPARGLCLERVVFS